MRNKLLALISAATLVLGISAVPAKADVENFGLSIGVVGNIADFDTSGSETEGTSRELTKASVSKDSSLLTSAYIDKANSKITLVIINSENKEINIQPNLQDIEIQELKTYVTSKDHNLELIPNTKSNIKVPAKSIISLVYQIAP